MDANKYLKENASQSNVDSTGQEFQNEKDPKSSAISQNFESGLVDSGIQIESPTPEKPESRKKGNVISALSRNLLAENFKEEGAKSFEIPDKFKDLFDLFKEMEISIRLLGLRKKIPTLTNISTQVEILTKRKFTSKHLAQIKYLIPDIIQIERILIHDEKSLCMFPDLKLSILKDSVKTLNLDQSFSAALRESFHSSLLNFINNHPKDTDIPESILPEPFNSTEQNINIKTLCKDSTFSKEEGIMNTSHFPPTFRKSTFQETKSQNPNPEVIQTTFQEIKSRKPNPESIQTDETTVTQITEPYKSPLSIVKLSGIVTPNRGIKCADVALTETPAQQTPKRALPTPNNNNNNNNNDDNSSGSGKKEELSEVTVTRSARKSLFYSESKFQEEISNLNEGLSYESGNIGVEGLNEKVSQIGEANRDSLPLTFDTIYQISKSKDCSLITKKELVHKILSTNLEIDEPSEAEEHLRILEEMVPDWICKKSLDGGEILYSVKSISDPKGVRSRLIEAI